MSTAEVRGLLEPGEKAEEGQGAAGDREEETDPAEDKPPTNGPIFQVIEINMVPLGRHPPARRKLAFRPQDPVQNDVIIETGRYPFCESNDQEPEADLGEENRRNQGVQGPEDYQKDNA